METRAFVFPCQSVPVVCGDASMRELCFYVFSVFFNYMVVMLVVVCLCPCPLARTHRLSKSDGR